MSFAYRLSGWKRWETYSVLSNSSRDKNWSRMFFKTVNVIHSWVSELLFVDSDSGGNDTSTLNSPPVGRMGTSSDAWKHVPLIGLCVSSKSSHEITCKRKRRSIMQGTILLWEAGNLVDSGSMYTSENVYIKIRKFKIQKQGTER